jgi:stage V sporulation protein B
MGRVEAPVKNAAITLVVHVLFVLAMLYFTPGTLSVLVAGSVVYSFLMCVLNGRSLRKFIDYRMNYKKIFVMPGISAAIMAVVAYLVYDGVYALLSSNIISLVIAIIIAVIVYAFMMLKTGACTEDDLLNMPKGAALVRLAKKLHLLK